MTCESQNINIQCTTRTMWLYNGTYGALELCDAHAYALIHTYAGDREVIQTNLKSMATARATIQCGNCKSVFRLERVGVVTHVGMPAYCPHCGAKANGFNDPERDYWELLSESLQLPVSITTALYDAWDRDDYPNFGDFVKAMKNGAASA